MQKTEFKRHTAKNISINAVGKAIMFGLQALTNIILTRTLGADDYGLVGMALIFVNFLTVFGDMGVSNAVIRKEHLSERDVWTGFYIRLIQGGAVILFCLALVPLVNILFSNPEIGKILFVFSLNYFIYAFGFVPNAYLSRELRYDLLFIPQVASSLIGSAVGIIMVMNGGGYWSLVISTISTSIASVVFLNILRPIKPYFCFDLDVSKHFISYGMNIFLVSFVSYVLLNAGNFVIGAIQGPKELGFFTIASNWGLMIYVIIINVFSSVLFPTFAKIQDDKIELKRVYLRFFEVIGLLAILVNLTLLITEQDFLYLILGHSTEKWFPSIMTLKIFCGVGILKSIFEPCTNLMMAIGDTTTLFRATLVAAVVQLLLLYPAIHFGGIEGIALLVFFATVIQSIVYLPSLKRYIGLSIKDMFFKIWPVLISMLLTWVVMSFSAQYIGSLTLLAFVTKITLIWIVFLGCYGVFTRWVLFCEIKKQIFARRSVV